MATTTTTPEETSGHLTRSVGFYGLMFVSLGSIIGSGWLLGALTAATTAGPASILSWVLSAVMLASLALVYAELGATYPVAGGSGRFPYYSHGPIVGFVGSWSSWIQAVFIAPIEVLAALTYLNSVTWIRDHASLLRPDSALLNTRGLVVALLMMVGFLVLNLRGAGFMSESNTFIVIWKTAVPFLAIGVIATLSFHPGNLTAGGGFMPFGWHGVFEALPLGVVFALQGFEQAVQLAGEARNPRKDLSRAILCAMGIGALLYTLLQVAMLTGFDPKNVAHGWSDPLGHVGDFGAWYTLALAVGATWLGVILILDAFISPAGTGLVYLGATARLSFALGHEPEMPDALARTTKGVPVVSLVVAFVVGCIGFGPFKSWSSLVGAVTGATAVMYALAPIALSALHRSDADRPRTYRMPLPRVLLPVAFVSANLILYWGGWAIDWKVVSSLGVGLALYAVGAVRRRTFRRGVLASSWWMAVWLPGMLVISYLGQYDTPHPTIPSGWDLVTVIVFCLAIYGIAGATRLQPNGVTEEVAKDAKQLAGID